MNQTSRTLSILGAAVALAAIACDGDDGVRFNDDQWQTIRDLGPLPGPAGDPTNKYLDDAAAAELGQMLFFEKAYSGPLVVGDDGENGGLGEAGESGLLSCASCHDGPWMIDLRSRPGHVSLGSDWVPRNATSMVNAAYYAPWSENDGIRDSGWSKNMIDLEDSIGANSSRLRLAHVLFDKYRAEYDAVFDDPLPAALDPDHPEAARFPAEGKPGTPAWDGMTAGDRDAITRVFVNYGKALHAYERRLTSAGASFDRFVALGPGPDGEGVIGEAAERGLALFIGDAGCVRCHSGPALTDNQFHNLGMAWMGEHITEDWEQGRYGGLELLLADDFEFRSDSPWSDDPAAGAERLAQVDAEMVGGAWVIDEATRGQWRTKSLRHVAQTAPYMHNGQLATLHDVVDLYNRGGDDGGYIGEKSPLMQPLGLSDDEVDDLVAFLRTLTGAEVPFELRRDTSKP